MKIYKVFNRSGHGADDYEPDEGEAYTYAYQDDIGKPLASLKVNVVHPDKRVHVRYIEVAKPYRRQGIGSNLMKAMIKDYPNYEIESNSFTDAGEALFDSLGLPHENSQP